MSYKLSYTDTFKETIGGVGKPNAEQVEHERLKNPPSGLEKICKYRVAPY